MADHETDMSKAEQRSAAVERLRRAASLPRMKDGRRPPMHVEAVSEGERAQGEEERGGTETDKTSDEAQMSSNERENEMDALESKTSDPDSDHLPIPTQKPVDVDVEADTELEERSLSPTTAFKKRRSRSRSRSRGSKDFKGKFKPPQSPAPQIAGDSSQDEKPPLPPPALVPMVPPLLSPVPHFPFLQQSRFLRSPGPVTPEMALFYPGTSPSTPLPTLEDLQRGLIRSNSAGSAAAAGRRMAMHKLTGGTETYDPPSSSPTPPPSVPKLSRNNTVSGGERIAARQNMLNRLGTRITKKEVDAEAASSAEDRSAISPSPTAKRRRRRSRKNSTAPNPNITISDSEFNSTAGDTVTPVTPHPAVQEQYVELRAQSVTPNQLSSSRNQSHERPPVQDTSPPPLPVQSAVSVVDDGFKGQEQAHRRSVLVEDPEEDEEDRYVPTQRYTPSSGTPVHAFSNQENLRLYQHPSETSSNGPLDSRSPSSMGLSIAYNQRAPSRNGLFTNSPFNVPLKERALSEEEEEERVLYPVPRVESSSVEFDSQERILSWVASPVPEYRMPVDEDEDDEVQEIEVHMGPDEGGEDDTHPSPASHNQYLPDDGSSSSQSVVLEIEAAREHLNLYNPSSPGPVSQPPSVDGSVSPQFMPTRLSVASRIQSIGDRSPLTTEFSEWDDKYASADSSKREPSSSPWEKAKNILSRAGSRTGRRSRTNSIAARERREHNTDSSISRESGASLTTTKTDQGDVQNLVQVQAPPLMQSPSASASISSLAPHAPTRGSVSPIPPPSSSDMAKYQNAKLFPFPGMLKLEEERRAKNYILPSSNQDAGSQPYEEVQAQATGYPFATTSTPASDVNRERGLSREHSDQRLHTKYGTEQSVMTPGPSSHPEYIDVSPPQQNGSSYNLKLPTTLPGVKQWLSKNSKKKTASPAGSMPGTVTLPLTEPQSTPPITNKKPSISDIFNRKTNELADWDDSPEPLIVHDDSSPLKQLTTASSNVGIDRVNVPERTQTPKGHQLPPLEFGSGRASPFKFPTGPSVNRLTAATPDPSSISEYPAPTASESSSTSSSLSSSSAARIRQIILDRLDEHISKTFRLEDTPRKLILSSPVLQVVNPNTVKDRFLFLFNDILIIAKPVNFDQDSLMDTYKLSLPDRKYTVKSVVQLRNVHFCADRSDAGKIQANSPRNALLRTFVSQFPKEPDQAIATLFTKSGLSDDPVLLGQLLFKTLDLDRSSLGEYLSRKTSKTVLKSYLDSFGFAGLRVDVALRVFLQSINVSRYSQSYAALELLLDAFASRWYEANAKFVAYDKDMAIRLIRGLAQLNERLHGSIADEPGPTDHIHRNVSSKEFVDAFRRHDVRYFVSDELLQDLYRSVYRERLCQATVSGSQETVITIKRPLPGRLIYKAQSDPIIFRLPQADPGLTIALYGQDLTFDPPVLQFIKSSEASFRVTGTSLGTKSITMCRSGPNAIKYSGIPLSHTVVVERAFMRNTFQLAFLNHAEEKRRYMFSVDDPIIRNEWATSIRRHIDSSTVSSSTATGPSHDASKFRKAADAVAFKVLQDTLMGNYTPTHRLNGSYNSNISAIASQFGGPGIPLSGSIHARSKSRSRVYRHGAGRNELDLPAGSSQDCNDLTGESSDHAHTPEQADGALWTARDLEVQCQQNSTIGQVLSYVQLGLAEGSPPFS